MCKDREILKVMAYARKCKKLEVSRTQRISVVALVREGSREVNSS